MTGGTGLRLAALVAALLAGGAGAELPPGDRQWMEGVLELWRGVSARELGLGERPLPWVVFFDAGRVWHVNPEPGLVPVVPEGEAAAAAAIRYGTAELPAIGFAHRGAVRLPDGGEIPPRLILFASTYGEAATPYFVMAMPEVWRATPRHADDPDLDALIAGVFLHEITHTQQARALGPRIDRLAARLGLPDDEVDDDLIQRRFGERPGHREAYERERDLLYAAAAAGTAAETRALARRALAAIRERRALWYRGEEAPFAELEEIFLDFEGVANWTAYRGIVASGVPPARALLRLRGEGRRWSQDEGLALFLVLERLGAPWRATVFSAEPVSAFAMLEAATGDEPGPPAERRRPSVSR
jgi:hypothetical protein